MDILNLPVFEFKIKNEDKKSYIFDEFRKKWVTLTPEEWVRQNFAQYLCTIKKYPISHIGIEVSIQVNKQEKRCDVVIYDNFGNPQIIVECKAPSVKLSQKTFDQIASYNMKLNVQFLIVTNGLNHYCCLLNYVDNVYTFLKEIPEYK